MALLTGSQTMTVLSDLERAIDDVENNRNRPIADVARMLSSTNASLTRGDFPSEMQSQVATFLANAQRRFTTAQQQFVAQNQRARRAPYLIDGSGRGDLNLFAPSSRPQDAGKVQIHIEPQIREDVRDPSKAPPAAEAPDEAAPRQASILPFSIGWPWLLGIGAIVAAWWIYGSTTEEE